jgi:hypothetical protein
VNNFQTEPVPRHPLLYNRSFIAMQSASTTLKKIFADTLRRGSGDAAPLLALPLACGSKVAEKTSAISYADGVLTVEVPDVTWQHQLESFSRQYVVVLKQISGQSVTAIKFVVGKQTDRRSRWRADR